MSRVLAADDLAPGMLVTVHHWQPTEELNYGGIGAGLTTVTSVSHFHEGDPFVIVAIDLPYVFVQWLIKEYSSVIGFGMKRWDVRRVAFCELSPAMLSNDEAVLLDTARAQMERQK